MKDGTHVALDHEDTSQGAVHSFQVTYAELWIFRIREVADFMK